MKRMLLLAVCAVMTWPALCAPEGEAPTFVYGTATAVSATGVTIQGRGANTALVAMSVNADTKFGVAKYAKAADITKDAVVAIIAGKDANAPAKAVGICVPSETNKAANELLSTVGFRLAFLGGARTAKAVAAVKTLVGTVTAIDGGTLTVKLADRTITVSVTAETAMLKVDQVKDSSAIEKDQRSMAQYSADKVAKVVLRMPDPPKRG